MLAIESENKVRVQPDPEKVYKTATGPFFTEASNVILVSFDSRLIANTAHFHMSCSAVTKFDVQINTDDHKLQTHFNTKSKHVF